MDYLEEKERNDKEISDIMTTIQGYDSDVSDEIQEINPVQNPDEYEYDLPSFNIKTELTDLFPDEEFDRPELIIKQRRTDSELEDNDLVF